MTSADGDMSSSRSKSYQTDLENLAISSISATSIAGDDVSLPVADDAEDDGADVERVGRSRYSRWWTDPATPCSYPAAAVPSDVDTALLDRPIETHLPQTLIPLGAPSVSTITKSGSDSTFPYQHHTTALCSASTKTPVSLNARHRGGIRSGSAPKVYSGSCKRRTPSTGQCGRSGSSSVQRRPVRTGVTPTTATPGDCSASSCVVALAGGRGNAFGEVGVAAFDPLRPCVVLAQFSDSYTFVGVIRKISVLNPCKILIPGTFMECGKVLHDSLCREFGEEIVCALPRGHFQSSVGLQRLTALCQPVYSGVLQSLTGAYYCSSAAAALLDYLEFNKSICFRSKTLKIELQSAESTAIIDCDTARRLELVASSDPARGHHTLFSTLRRTKTAGGTRRLRAELLQPSVDLDSINGRLECVGELVENPELLYQLRAVIGRFQDIEKVHCFCIQQHPASAFKNVDQRLNSVMSLKTSLDAVNALRQCLQSAHNGMFVTLRSLLNDDNLQSLMTYVGDVIHDDVKTGRSAVEMKVWRCYAIRSRINGLLDVARRLYTETTDSFVAYVSSMAEELSLPLKPACNMARGLHITAYIPKYMAPSELPAQLIQIQRRRDNYVFTTEKVMQLDAKAEYTVSEISKMANIIVCSLLDKLTPHLGFLYQLSEVVTSVDLMVGFADLAVSSALCRPEFGDTMCIRGGSHPLLLASSDTSAAVVPNDTILDRERRLMILTGANMTGKSTYLKQVAVIQILAQVGCFVPANSATLCVVDRVFYRAGHDETHQMDSSAFTSEMRDVCHILHESTANSLVLVDELCRATDTLEGTAICWSICEQLMSKRCRAIIATHYQQLSQLENSYYPFMINCHLTSSDDLADGWVTAGSSSNISPQGVVDAKRHRLLPGPAQCQHYGLRAASVVGLSPLLIDTAYSLLSRISSRENRRTYDHTESSHARLVYQLADDVMATLANCAPSDQEQKSARLRLQQLRRDFISVQLSTRSSDGTPLAANEQI